MIDLNGYWAIDSRQSDKALIVKAELSPAHRLDIAGVASSILATPTIENPVKPVVLRGFCLLGGSDQPCRAHNYSGQS